MKNKIAFAALMGVASAALADNHGKVHSSNITEQEVLAAQKAWGEALVAISTEGDKKGVKSAKVLASNIIDKAYGYDLGPVLFKPTLTTGDQTFRTTKEGALAYFVGQDSKFPSDKGFALNGWTKVEVKNAAVSIHGDTALTMGNVFITNKKGDVTKVDKTWAFKKTDQGQIKIVLHHSSLPYVAK